MFCEGVRCSRSCVRERCLQASRSPFRSLHAARGLLGRSGCEGALWLPRTRSVHTFGMRFPIDVVYLDRDGVVIATPTLAPNRVGRPHRGGRAVVEAEAGAFERWRFRTGDRLELKG